MLLTWKFIKSKKETGSICINFKEDFLELKYQTRWRDGDWKEIEENIVLEKTIPNLGGIRYWFVCPACSRRCAFLYGGTHFRCRLCLDICYKTQLEDKLNRAFSRLDKIREKLNNHDGIASGFPLKPKWMRYKTYHKLEMLYETELNKIASNQQEWDELMLL